MLQSLVFEIARFLGGGVCHQFPERSFRLGSLVLPLCARCTGTYLGAVIGFATVILYGRTRAGRLPSWPALATLGAFFAAWGIDGVNSYLTLFPGAPHLYEPNNTLRLLTGTLEGLTLSLVIWPVAALTLWRQPLGEPVIRLRELAAPMLVAAGVVALVTLGPPGILFAAGVLSAVGLLGLFALLNVLVLTVVLHRENMTESPRQAVAPFAGALLLAALELSLLGLLRRWLLGF